MKKDYSVAIVTIKVIIWTLCIGMLLYTLVTAELISGWFTLGMSIFYIISVIVGIDDIFSEIEVAARIDEIVRQERRNKKRKS